MNKNMHVLKKIFSRFFMKNVLNLLQDPVQCYKGGIITNENGPSACLEIINVGNFITSVSESEPCWTTHDRPLLSSSVFGKLT